MSARHRCTCPLIPQTWLVLAGFLAIVILHNLAQQYNEFRPEYPTECTTLEDLGFRLLPRWTFFPEIADVWIVVSLFSTFMLFLFVLERPQLLFRRFLLNYGTVFFLRAFTVMATTYPRVPFDMARYQSDNLLWGAILILVGVRKTALDMMFSGHTAGFILCALFIWRYSKNSLLAGLFFLFNVGGIVALVSVREHYTADVLVAIVIAYFVFGNYHLWMDSEYVRFWRPGLEIVSVQPTVLYPPLVIKDQSQKEYEVHLLGQRKVYVPTKDRDQDSLVVNPTVSRLYRVKETNQTYVRLNLWQYVTWARFRYYAWWKWLDAE